MNFLTLEGIFTTLESGPKREKVLTEDEQTYYSKLIKKYGTDYKVRFYLDPGNIEFLQKMQRDMKLNFNQDTKKTLQKKCELYLLKYGG